MSTITRRGVTVLIGALACIVSSAFGVQSVTRPDFSGSWSWVPPQPPPADPKQSDQRKTKSKPPVASFGSTFLAKQEINTLTLKREIAGKEYTMRIDLTGQQSVNVEGPVETVSIAKWDGDTLILDSVSRDPRFPIGTTRRVISIDQSGNLVIHTSGEGHDLGISTYRRQQ